METEALNFVWRAREKGATRNEFADYMVYQDRNNAMQSFGPPFTYLHQAGEVVRLDLKRGGRYVYVAPKFVNGRDVRPAKYTIEELRADIREARADAAHGRITAAEALDLIAEYVDMHDPNVR